MHDFAKVSPSLGMGHQDNPVSSRHDILGDREFRPANIQPTTAVEEFTSCFHGIEKDPSSRTELHCESATKSGISSYPCNMDVRTNHQTAFPIPSTEPKGIWEVTETNCQKLEFLLVLEGICTWTCVPMLRLEVLMRLQVEGPPHSQGEGRR